jgi:hypothetical protein
MLAFEISSPIALNALSSIVWQPTFPFFCLHSLTLK